MERTFPGGAGRTSTLNTFTLARLDASASGQFSGSPLDPAAISAAGASHGRLHSEGASAR